MEKGQHFGEESIIELLSDVNWFIKLKDVQIYNILCESYVAEALIFDVYSISKIIKNEPHTLLKLQ